MNQIQTNNWDCTIAIPNIKLDGRQIQLHGQNQNTTERLSKQITEMSHYCNSNYAFLIIHSFQNNLIKQANWLNRSSIRESLIKQPNFFRQFLELADPEFSMCTLQKRRKFIKQRCAPSINQHIPSHWESEFHSTLSTQLKQLLA